MRDRELQEIRDPELREILRNIKRNIKARGAIRSGGPSGIPGARDPPETGQAPAGALVDVYRYGQPIGRFRCPGYERYSPRDGVCRHFSGSKGTPTPFWDLSDPSGS